MTVSTLIKSDKNNSPAFEQGDLVSLTASDAVVMVTESEGKDGPKSFKGVVVYRKAHTLYALGFFSPTWNKEYFGPFEGSIQLDSE